MCDDILDVLAPGLKQSNEYLEDQGLGAFTPVRTNSLEGTAMDLLVPGLSSSFEIPAAHVHYLERQTVAGDLAENLGVNDLRAKFEAQGINPDVAIPIIVAAMVYGGGQLAEWIAPEGAGLTSAGEEALTNAAINEPGLQGLVQQGVISSADAEALSTTLGLTGGKSITAGNAISQLAGPAVETSGGVGGFLKNYGPLIATGVGVVGQAYGANQASNAAEKQTEVQQAYLNKMGDIATQQWNRYLEKYAPLENKLIEDVSAEQPIGLARTLATLDRGYSDVTAITRRTMGGRYPSGSGLETQALKDIELERGKSKAGATADANVNRFNQMMNVANLGRGLPTAASTGLSSVANQYGNLANMYNQAAAQGWTSMGNTASNMLQWYLMTQPGKGFSASPQ